ncbi:MAG TPA: hypothetical protein VMN36_07050 [Verrucomicrobiales bacterium]|nr:hypothetical protein [Verrucomicrobiales bacterium]
MTGGVLSAIDRFVVAGRGDEVAVAGPQVEIIQAAEAGKAPKRIAEKL